MMSRAATWGGRRLEENERILQDSEPVLARCRIYSLSMMRVSKRCTRRQETRVKAVNGGMSHTWR